MTHPAPLRLAPSTVTLHLDFKAGEDVDVVVDVVDRAGVPVLLSAATARISQDEDGPVLHEWSAAAGNLVLLPDPADATHLTRVQLSQTRAQTAAWLVAWGTARWQLDVVDVFGKQKTPCEGQVRVRSRLAGGT